MRRRPEPKTWAAAYRELCAIDELAKTILARWQARIEEAVAQAGCCITIAEVLREFHARAWRCAVREYERGKRAQPSPQLHLFNRVR